MTMKLFDTLLLGSVVIACVVVVSVLKKVIRKDLPHKPQPPHKPPPRPIRPQWPPQVVCWNCNEVSDLPRGTAFGDHVFCCGYCNIDNQVRITPQEDGEVFMGDMVVTNVYTNRCKAYF